MEVAVKAELISLEVETIKSIATAGSYVGLFIEFTGPLTAFIGYSAKWVDHYTENGFAMSDPTLLWGQQNTGILRWSEMDIDDENLIIKNAKKFGLKFGATAAIVISGKRSVGLFSREDREFNQQELDILLGSVRKLHLAHSPSDSLTDLETETMKLLIEGNTSKQAAEKLGVADQTVKLRLLTLRRKFGVKTNIELAVLATNMKLV